MRTLALATVLALCCAGCGLAATGVAVGVEVDRQGRRSDRAPAPPPLPPENPWVAVAGPDLNDARGQHAATVLDDGRVLSSARGAVSCACVHT